MPKTYYLGRTTSGAVVCRESTRPTYTHAATSADTKPGEVLGAGKVCFSTSPDGAVRAWGKWARAKYGVEVVPLQIVTAAEFNAATGRR